MNSEYRLKNTRTDHIEELLSKGADERIMTDEHGKTKYSLPLIHESLINRGSCTCSPASGTEIDCISHALNNLNSEDEWKELIESNINRLKDILNVKKKDDIELFFAPSGTDLVYYPIIFSRLLHPSKKILNITTCIEELGSGTRLAAVGRYYSNFNQFEESIEKGSSIDQSGEITAEFFKARTEDGEILNNRDEIISLIEHHKDRTIIINLVYGSKSGIEDSIGLIDDLNGENIIWNTDFCQFRHSSQVINKLLQKQSCVMITGSKFYQTPPFCAALIVPKSLCNRLSKAKDWSVIEGYRSIFSAYDFPDAFRNKTGFSKRINHSLHLRWLCALDEIERYNELSVNLVNRIINRWRDTLLNYIEEKKNIELMPFQQNANKTILSFRIKDENGYLNHTELKNLHKKVITSSFSFLPEQTNLFIGQPVNYVKDKSFIRMAIGSKNIRKFIRDNEKEFDLDKKIVDAITSQLVK